MANAGGRQMLSTLFTTSRFGGVLVSQGWVKPLAREMSLPKKTLPEPRLVMTRFRLLTSLRLAAGLAGGSVQTSVKRNGRLVAAGASETKRVWLWPVARASAGLWSNTCMGAAAPTKELERPTGRLLVRLTKPQPWELV